MNKSASDLTLILAAFARCLFGAMLHEVVARRPDPGSRRQGLCRRERFAHPIASVDWGPPNVELSTRTLDILAKSQR